MRERRERPGLATRAEQIATLAGRGHMCPVCHRPMLDAGNCEVLASGQVRHRTCVPRETTHTRARHRHRPNADGLGRGSHSTT